ncbi:MFS general substrate transporter [Obba rivulosa]|uniref:MFS general substrate transporter n=1 Tax=Obba rivulosa TaxID=1052685 RepID=A0A8E2DLP4_9APHY|nr:MFS general substrate transporter [Obba rivulosa]
MNQDMEKSTDSDSELQRVSEQQADIGPVTVEPHPEGGLQAWTVIFGAALSFFATFGFVNSFGVFQDYYQTTLLNKSSSSTISLIGAIQLFFMYGAGPIVGRIYDAYGTNILLPLGTVITVFSLMMVSLAQENKPYQLFLSQGILFGIGISLIFNPALAVASHWFKRKRAYAIGIVAAGSAMGGVVYPIMLQRLIPRVGFGWAVRIAAFVTLVCLGVGCLTIRTRLPLSRRVSLRGLVDLDGFRELDYVLTGVGSFLVFYALFTPYFYMELYAESQGVSPNISTYLLPIINAWGVPSRVLPGMLADKIGALNVLVPCTLICGIFVLGLWLTAHTTASIIAFSSIYGLCIGAFVSLIPAHVANISPMEKFGARLGSIYLLVAVSTLVGTPTAGAFVTTIDQSNFDNLIIFTGVLILVGGLLLLLAGLAARWKKHSAEVRA